MVLDTLTATDRVNLLELYARSSMLLDLGRCEEWSNLFEEQAVLRCGSRMENAARYQYVGRRQILQLAREIVAGTLNLALVRSSAPVPCCHILSNVCFFADGSRNARGYAHLMVTTRGGMGPPSWLAAGVYIDRLWKCTSGNWVFESRVFTSGELPQMYSERIVGANPSVSGV